MEILVRIFREMGLFVQGNAFDAGSRPCPERSVSPGTPVFLKANTFKFQFVLKGLPNKCSALNTLRLK